MNLQYFGGHFRFSWIFEIRPGFRKSTSAILEPQRFQSSNQVSKSLPDSAYCKVLGQLLHLGLQTTKKSSFKQRVLLPLYLRTMTTVSKERKNKEKNPQIWLICIFNWQPSWILAAKNTKFHCYNCQNRPETKLSMRKKLSYKFQVNSTYHKNMFQKSVPTRGKIYRAFF